MSPGSSGDELRLRRPSQPARMTCSRLRQPAGSAGGGILPAGSIRTRAIRGAPARHRGTRGRHRQPACCACLLRPTLDRPSEGTGRTRADEQPPQIEFSRSLVARVDRASTPVRTLVPRRPFRIDWSQIGPGANEDGEQPGNNSVGSAFSRRQHGFASRWGHFLGLGSPGIGASGRSPAPRRRG